MADRRPVREATYIPRRLNFFASLRGRALSKVPSLPSTLVLTTLELTVTVLHLPSLQGVAAADDAIPEAAHPVKEADAREGQWANPTALHIVIWADDVRQNESAS